MLKKEKFVVRARLKFACTVPWNTQYTHSQHPYTSALKKFTLKRNIKYSHNLKNCPDNYKINIENALFVQYNLIAVLIDFQTYLLSNKQNL